MTITTNDDRDEYTATASQTVFNYTFKIFASTDLNVYQTPAGQTANDSTDLITAYTVSGVGSASGGTITLTTPASAGDLITIVSNIPSSRTTDYQVSGDFSPDTVNNDFDRMVSLSKQSEGVARRALLFPESQQNASGKTMDPPLALGYWRWRSDSSGVEYAALPTFSSTDAIFSVPDYAALKALDVGSYSDGQTISIAHRSTIGGGGGGTFYWDSSDNSANVTADPGAVIYVPPDSDASGASGVWVRNIPGGLPSADEIADKKIEIVSGTLRQQQPAAVSGITRAGTSAICVETAHGREVGDYVVIRGADQTGYNGTHEIAQVDDENTYRFLVDSGLTTPATGTITVYGADVWEWIKDSTHEPLGVNDSVPVRSDSSGYGLLIPFTKTYSKVLSVVVGPDETIAGAQGMVIGSSVSTSAIALRASLNKTVAGRVYWNGSAWAVSMGTDQGTVYTTNAPYPFNSISYSGGNLTLNHSFCPGADIRLTAHSGNGAATPYVPVIKSSTDSGCVVNFLYVNAGALALYTGAESTSLSFQFTKNSNRLIKFDGSDRSSETQMYFGNIWFYGIMQV